MFISMIPRRLVVLCGSIVLVVAMMGCDSSTKSAPEEDLGPWSKLPRLYWNVELVGIDAINPASRDDKHFIHLFDDGRIVTYQMGPTGEKVVVRSPETGAWKDVKIPAGQEQSFLTWYEDDANLGGYFYGAPSHGYALVDGVLHTFTGPPGHVKGRLPDGSLLLVSYANEYRYYQKWTFGPTLNDDLDIHDYFYQDGAKERVFAKLSKDGTMLLLPASTSRGEQAVIRNGVAVPIGYDQFRFQEGIDPIQEALLPCCHITTIDRVRGGILGFNAGKPVIKLGDTYDLVTGERGDPLAVNGRGDVLYTSWDSRTFHAPRMRFDGKLYQFWASDWNLPAKYDPNLGATGLPQIVDMNERGQVLFFTMPTDGSARGSNLYLATPSLTAVAPSRFVDLAFGVKSGSGQNLSAMESYNPASVTGSFSGGGFNLSIVMPSQIPGKTRTLYALVTAQTDTTFQVNSTIPVSTTLVGTRLVTASTTYADPSLSLTSVATAGAFRVKSQDGLGGFTVAIENIEFKAKDGTIYLLNGTAKVQK